jgi:hypothetical protein
MSQIQGIIAKYGRRGVGDYPDRIEGYLGCPPCRGGSNLRPWGNWEQSPSLPVALRAHGRDLRMTGEADNEH